MHLFEANIHYNSKYSNQQVWDQVRCNCFDGAEMIIEIASMLGLSGHMIHGSWNGIGHVAAMVNGQIYDMTQFQKRGGIFRGGSGVSFGSASPGGSKFNCIFLKQTYLFLFSFLYYLNTC